MYRYYTMTLASSEYSSVLSAMVELILTCLTQTQRQNQAQSMALVVVFDGATTKALNDYICGFDDAYDGGAVAAVVEPETHIQAINQ